MNDISNWKATSKVVAVFHTNAGHVTLRDQAYNADRYVATGNPYKTLVMDLMQLTEIDTGCPIPLIPLRKIPP